MQGGTSLVGGQLNDENAVVMTTGGGALASTLKGGGCSDVSALKPARRAFGANLTNTAPGTASKARRAFGADITNSVAKPGAVSQAVQQLKPAMRQPPSLSPAAASAAPPAQQWVETAPQDRTSGRTARQTR